MGTFNDPWPKAACEPASGQLHGPPLCRSGLKGEVKSRKPWGKPGEKPSWMLDDFMVWATPTQETSGFQGELVTTTAVRWANVTRGLGD